MKRINDELSATEEPPRWLLDCAQVSTPGEFYELYLDRVPSASGDFFGRNLDALWDALSADGPGAPGPCVIELRNTRGLRGTPLLEGLKRIAADLHAAGAEVSMFVLD